MTPVRRQDDFGVDLYCLAARAGRCRIGQLAEAVPRASAQLLALSGVAVTTGHLDQNQRKLKLRQQRIAQTVTDGTVLLETLRGSPADSDLTAGLQRMDELLVQLEVMKEDISDELRGLESDSQFRREQNAARQMAAGGRIPPPMPPV